jgi:hypothetical protein
MIDIANDESDHAGIVPGIKEKLPTDSVFKNSDPRFQIIKNKENTLKINGTHYLRESFRDLGLHSPRPRAKPMKKLDKNLHISQKGPRDW